MLHPPASAQTPSPAADGDEAAPAVLPTAAQLPASTAADVPTEAQPGAQPDTFTHDEVADLRANAHRLLGPTLGLAVAACEFLWRVADKQPLVTELRRRTGLNARAFSLLKAANTPEAFTDLWSNHLPAYYYALLVGRLVIESPLRAILVALLTPAPDEEAAIRSLLDQVVSIAADTAPLTERWLVGQHHAIPSDPLPDDPAQRAELAGWVERRTALEAYFRQGRAELARANAHFLASLAPPVTPTPTALAAPRGPFMRRTFTDAELAALRLLLTYVPKLTRLLPGQPFAVVMHGLSALQPPERVATLLERLRTIKPGQPLHFSLPDCLTLLQTLQSGALLLLRAANGDLIRALRRHADDPHDPDEDLRIERGRLLYLFSDTATRTQFRATFGPLLKHFTAAVDRLYPHAPELAQARAELADLAAVR